VQFYRRAMTQQGGWKGALLRPILCAAEATYSFIVNRRNRWYDRQGPIVRVPVPVIGVGNITVGGTGKTPLIIDLVQRLSVAGWQCAVIARGYGSRRGEPNDEQLLVQAAVPSVEYFVDRNRGRAAQLASRSGAEVILLDDAFQHRRLHRDLDIVLIDATCPFGYGRLLPRGLLREPLQGLRRAPVILVTRCDQVTHDELRKLLETLKALAPQAALLRSRHRVKSVETLRGVPIDQSLKGLRGVVICGIGNPFAFVATVQSLGVEIVDGAFVRDHHRYAEKDVENLFHRDRFVSHDIKFTTEKDAVKLRGLFQRDDPKLAVVKIAIDFLPGDDTMLQSVLDDLVRKSMATYGPTVPAS